MNTIDTNNATFNLDVLTRGYATSGKNGVLVYARKFNTTSCHFIVQDSEGLWEFTSFERSSAQSAADHLVSVLTIN